MTSDEQPHLLSPPPVVGEDSEEVWTPAPKGDPAAPVSDLLPHEIKWPSEWHLMCYMAAHGHSQRNIAKELGYSENWLSTVINKREVQERIERIRKSESEKLDRRFTELAPAALDIMENVIKGRIPAKTGEQLDAAKWVLEKKTGKAKTEGADQQGNVALQILQSLQAMSQARAAAAATPASGASAESAAIDVTPHVESAAEKWVRENLQQQAAKTEKETR